MDTPNEPIPVRALRALARAVLRHRRLFLYPQLGLFAASVAFTVWRLEFDMSRNNLVGSDKKYHQNFLRFRQEFGGEDDLVAVVESEDREKNRQFVERLGVRLEAETNLFTDVFYKGDLKMMGPKALLFIPEDTLAELRKTLSEYRPFIESFSRATNLNSLFRQVNQQFRTARREPNAENESMIRALPALRRIVEQATASLHRPGTPPAPGMAALFDGGDQAEQKQYITFAEGRIYLASARAVSDAKGGAAVERLRDLVRETQAEVPGVNAGITGEPVLEYDEMEQSKADSTVASVVSLALTALIFVSAYRETGRPLKATFCLIVGLGYTMGFTTLAVGHLNILTVTFLPILIGLAIDFGVHLITRYEEELRGGATEEAALEKAMVFTGMGIFTGCLTTAAAFFAMALTDFKGIQEMGIITGGGMLVCLVPMMTMLPVLLLRGRQNALDHPHAAARAGAATARRARVERLWLERPGLVAGVTLGLCALGALQMRKIYFDYNLLNMQSRGLPAVVYEEKLIHSASKSVLFAAVVADSLAEAQALPGRLTNLPTVASVDSMASFLAEDPGVKLEHISAIKREVASIHFAEPAAGPAVLPELAQTLFGTQGYVGLAGETVRKEGDAKLADELGALVGALKKLRRELNLGDTARNAERLGAFQRALFTDVRDTFAVLRSQDDRAGLRIEDLPAPLQHRFIGRTGKHLLQVYPKGNVWERTEQEKFVRDLRTVVPEVTGTPVQLYEYTTLLKTSYEKAAWYALAAIAAMVLVHFRSVPSVVLSLLPVAVGALWMGGLMGSFNLPFNPANIMTLPLVIGIGVTNGIHILNRFAEEQNPSVLAKSTGKAVLISGLTTIAGFGSLIPAEHQGISSLGVVMSVGIATCMVAALTFLPALLHLLIRAGWTIKKPSGANAQATLGREEPR